MSIWVLTSEHNAYDQYGAYFENAWHDKPTYEQVERALKDSMWKNWEVPEGLVSHVLEGGGRQASENTWFNLFRHK